MVKINKGTLDITKENIEKIKELFPNIITDGKIDFDQLKIVLGEEIDESNERYQFTWNGKKDSIKLAQTASTGTLRPSKDDSVNWGSTENLYIEGDNLEVLKQLQKTYFGKIKMIYIDPPYNTGGDFVYKDNFRENIKNYKEFTNQQLRSNPETSGRYHTDWLDMMYPRLILARNLLSEDGVVFISIDDNEVENLKKVMDEIFGENNFITKFVWEKTQHFGRQKLNFYSNIEYVLTYSKNLVKSSGMRRLLVEKIKNELEDAPLYNASNNFSHLVFPKNSVKFNIPDDTYTKTKDEKYSLLKPVVVKNGYNETELQIQFKSRWSQKKIVEEISNGCLYWIKSENFSVRVIYGESKESLDSPKQCIFTNKNNPLYATSSFVDKVGTSEEGSNELKLMFEGNYFDYPKPTSLIKYLGGLLWNDNNWTFEKDSIILDFFSGSATTAHAVMKLNAEDGGNRKFIMVQLPEKTDESSEAYKAGYENICEIGKERIRRAGNQIKEELEKEGKDTSSLDIGFKVFKLDETNIKEWDAYEEVTEQTLFNQKQILKDGRTKDDLLYEILLKYGVFDKKVKEITVNNKTMYSVGENSVILDLSDSITLDDVKAITQLNPMTVIFYEDGFEDDNVKINAEVILKDHSVEDVRSV